MDVTLFTSILEWIESSRISTAIRQSSWLYPFIEILHIFGIVLVAGSAVMFDIHLLASRKKGSLQDQMFSLLTWSKRGLILAIPTGLLLFSTNAVALGNDPVFAVKLILLLLAAVNAWIFHVRVYLPYYDKHLFPFKWPIASANATASIVLWMSIITCGRLLAY